PVLLDDVRRVLATSEPIETEIRDNTGRCFLARILSYHESEHGSRGVVMTFVNITERKHAEDAMRESEAWLVGQKNAFEAAVNGATLEESLGILVRTVKEQASGDVRCAFYLADHTRAELHHVVGMSESYAECVDGFKIGADSLACGLAVYTGDPVIYADVTKEPRWQPWLWLAARYEYRGWWSLPNRLSGRIVGTSAMYSKSTREITPSDHKAAALITRAAAIIISNSYEARERANAEEALGQSEGRLAHELADTKQLQSISRFFIEQGNPQA